MTDYAHTMGLDQLKDISLYDTGALDKLPFGVIQLDVTGRVLKYNLTESKLTGRSAESVVGRDFFTEVAPCTNVAECQGLLQRRRGAGAIAWRSVFAS